MHAQRGSAIIMLFIAVALFGLLTFAFLQGSRNNLNMMSSEAQKAEGVKTQDCANIVDMAAKRLSARGCTAAMLSYETDGSNPNPEAPSDGSCSIYHSNGGGIKPCTYVAGGPEDCSGLGDESYNDPVTGHCYFKVNAGATYAQAASDCSALGAYLAVPSSSAENNLLDANFTFSTNVWIGLSDSGAEGAWLYMYGELAGTQFWSGNEAGSVVGGQYNAWWTGSEPNDDMGNQDCGAYQMGDRKWDDANCGSNFGYFCEKTGTP